MKHSSGPWRLPAVLLAALLPVASAQSSGSGQPAQQPQSGQPPRQQPSGGEARGVNPADNITKIELQPRVSVTDDKLGISTATMTMKFDRAIRGTYGVSVELPLARFESPFGSNNGIGDTNVAFRAQKMAGRSVYLAGVQMVIPTATADALGLGKLQVNPTVGAVYAFSKTTFLAVVAKHIFSVAGDAKREDIRWGQYRTLLGYTSPKGYWLLADPQLWTDYRRGARPDFAPEFEVGKMVGPTTGVWFRGGGHVAGGWNNRQSWVVGCGIRFILL